MHRLERWEWLAPLLSPQRPRIGRAANDPRTVLDAILWTLRTGAPWRDLPERYGSWPTKNSRFQRWRQVGTWGQFLTTLQIGATHAGTIG